MDTSPTHETPRWVKWFGIIGIVVVVVLVAALVIGATTGNLGEHGPMRHLGGGGDGSMDHSGDTMSNTTHTMSHSGGNHTRPTNHGE